MGQTAPLTGELNFIASYFFNGCRTPWDIVIEMAQEPAGETALALISFGWEDIVKSFWRPKGLRINRHGRKKRRKKGGGGLPQINDLIAEKLDPYNDVFGPLHADELKIWWELENTIERVNYTMMIIDLVEQFVFKTIIGIIDLKATYCEVPGRASIAGKNIEILNNGQSYGIAMGIVKYEEWPCYTNLYAIIIDQNDWYQVLAGISVYNRGSHGGRVVLRVEIQAAKGGGIYEKVIEDLSPEGYESSIFSGIIQAPATVQIYASSLVDAVFTSSDIRVFPSGFTD